MESTSVPNPYVVQGSTVYKFANSFGLWGVTTLSVPFIDLRTPALHKYGWKGLTILPSRQLWVFFLICFFKIDLFIWLHWVLVAACGILVP